MNSELFEEQACVGWYAFLLWGSELWEFKYQPFGACPVRVNSYKDSLHCQKIEFDSDFVMLF